MTEIKNLYGLELLRELSLAFGPTGCEDNVAEAIKSVVKPHADEITLDKMGNLVAVLYGKNHGTDKEKRLLFSAHMDEVGFMINDICGDGTLKFSLVGGIIPYALGSRRVTVGDETNRIKGTIASKAIHSLSPAERREALDADKLYVDIGAKNDEETKSLLSVGDYGTFDSDFVLFGENDRLMKSKAIDDRLGCAVMIETLRYLDEQGIQLPYDVYFCFTTREEIGLSGAQTAAQAIAPDVSIVLETTAVADIAGVGETSKVAKLGEGGAISLADRSTIYNRALVDYAMELSRTHGFKAQIKKYISGGNDAGTIHKTAEGIKTLAISVPTRYLHSAACVASIKDYVSVRDLCEQIIRSERIQEEI